MNSRLTRSSTDKFLGGVCGGLGNYLGVDSTILRIVFLLLVFGSGFGLLLYLVLWILVPLDTSAPKTGQQAGEFLEERMKGMGEDIVQATGRTNAKAGLWVGLALVIFGGIVLLQNMHIPWLEWISFTNLWPVIIILIGIAFLFRGWKGR